MDKIPAELEFLMTVTKLDELLEDELKDIYSAETQLIKALPKMARAAESDDLRAAFEQHLEQTRVHAKRTYRATASARQSPSRERTTCPSTQTTYRATR